jgi:hypothetical protein
MAEPASDDERLAKLIDRLQHKTTARPSRRKTLLSHINGFYGNRLAEPELSAIVETLEQRGIVRLDTEGRVDYPAQIQTAPEPETRAPSPRRPRARSRKKREPDRAGGADVE